MGLDWMEWQGHAGANKGMSALGRLQIEVCRGQWVRAFHLLA